MGPLGGFTKGSPLWNAQVASTVIGNSLVGKQSVRGTVVCRSAIAARAFLQFHPVFTGLQESAFDNGFEELGRLVNG